jgi:hypothetical protein
MRGLIVGAAAALVLLAGPSPATAAKYYVVVRGVDEAEGVHSGIKDEALGLFTAELKKHPELTLEPPPGLPTEPEALKAALTQKKLRAIELTLRILGVTNAVNPPPPGKKFRVLLRGIKLAVIGDTIPDKVLALGGDGDAQVGVEIDANANVEKEGKPALLDATKEAMRQAVDMTVAKLKMGDKVPKLKKPKSAKK